MHTATVSMTRYAKNRFGPNWPGGTPTRTGGGPVEAPWSFSKPIWEMKGSWRVVARLDTVSENV